MIVLMCIPKLIGTILLLLLLGILAVGYIGGIVMAFKKSARDGFAILGIGVLTVGFCLLMEYLMNYPCQ